MARRPSTPVLALAIVTAAVVAAVSFWVLSPRLGHVFPSMVDDWAAISRSPDQIQEAMTLRNPEDTRYRPTWIVWNYLQWHTFGAPLDLRVPWLWGLLRTLVLIGGVAAATFVLTRRGGDRSGATVTRALLVGGVALAVVTIPALAIDIARYGPQEPLMVGLMCGGAALYALTVLRALDDRGGIRMTPLLAGIAALLLIAGIGQKESSICALALVPFLFPAVRQYRSALVALPMSIRLALSASLGLVLVSFVPVLYRTAQLALADERIYGAEPADGIIGKAVRQLSGMDDALQSQTGWYLLATAIALTVAVALSSRLDWIAVGLIVTAFAFLLFASSTNILASRYYLPTVALACFAVARSVSALQGARATVLASLLVIVGLWQAPEARDAVQGWIGWERQQEAIVREVARINAAGCGVEVTGPDIEFVEALPVLAPMADEGPGACDPGERFVAILTGTSPWAENPEDPPVVACGAKASEVARNGVGRILRCTPPG